MKDSYTRSQDDFFKRFLDGIKYYVLLSIILGIVALILALLMAPMVGYFISAAYIAAIIIGVLFLVELSFSSCLPWARFACRCRISKRPSR